MSAAPQGGSERAQRIRTTTRLTFKQANVKQSLINGIRMTMLSTVATMGTNFLNAYMTTHGMEGRVFSVTLQPNPQRSASVNPLKRTTSGF